jgi:hypothetical protein
MFQSRKAKTEYVPSGYHKNWANATNEIERLGKQLDAVRVVLAKYKTAKQKKTWAYKHWRSVEAIVLRKWTLSVRLRDVGLVQVGKAKPGPAIRYDWWEGTEEIAMRFPILDNIAQILTDKFGNSRSLERAWAMAMEEKLQKARQGQA